MFSGALHTSDPIYVRTSGFSEPFNVRLRDYNTYYEDRPAYQFKWKQDRDGNPLVDGMLNVCWGLKKAIRLQVRLLQFRMSLQVFRDVGI